MIKKIITTTTLLVASVALANAACVAYTFCNNTTTQATGATNISVTGGPPSIGASATKLSETFLGSASLTITAQGTSTNNKLFANVSDNISGSYIGTTGLGLLTTENPALTGGVSGISHGLQHSTTGAGNSVVFTVAGLAASTDYTVTMIVKPASTSSAISWTGGSLVSGSYVVGSNSTVTTISTGTSVTIGSTTEAAVSLKLTTDANGGFTITFPGSGGSGGTDSTRTVIGYFAISGSTVPEPSAFSLLAGIGAIALAVSRRRRKH